MLTSLFLWGEGKREKEGGKKESGRVRQILMWLTYQCKHKKVMIISTFLKDHPS